MLVIARIRGAYLNHAGCISRINKLGRPFGTPFLSLCAYSVLVEKRQPLKAASFLKQHAPKLLRSAMLHRRHLEIHTRGTSPRVFVSLVAFTPDSPK